MKSIFWAGLALRLACAPFLLQWFHPDERQLLEFAHFHAHGRLHPFLESALHLRNQTAPWLASWLVRFCDGIGLGTPQAYLLCIHLALAVWSWLGLWSLVEYLRQEFPRQEGKLKWFAWFLASFWAFPFLYSRGLLEALSIPPTFFALLAISRWNLGRAGFWSGLVGVLRYPSALWSVGAFALVAMAWARRERIFRARDLALLAGGFMAAVSLGGLADWATYGRFMDSAFSYWEFNRPHGPVESIFGNDSLEVYWRWFDFAFTPWVAPLFMLVGAFFLARSPRLLVFSGFYVLGHLWTPHREPRFMIPLTPVLALAIAEGFCAKDWFASVRSHGVLRWAAHALLLAHVALNFAWYPVTAWAQWNSGQGVLLRSWEKIASANAPLLTLADPLIDALVPPGTAWSDRKCRWRRPPPAGGVSRVLVLSERAPGVCARIMGLAPDPSSLMRETLQRLTRTRLASLYDCSAAELNQACPSGITPPGPDEPYFSRAVIAHPVPEEFARPLSSN